MQNRERVFIALGSNLQQPKQQVLTAMDKLEQLPHSQLLACSSLYETAPMGEIDQPNYINAVVEITTALSAKELLYLLLKLEVEQGRVRDGTRWGARIIDCDILLYGQQQINGPELIVPHPGLRQRNFVLYPLFEIAPDLKLEDGTSIETLVAATSAEGIKKLESEHEHHNT